MYLCGTHWQEITCQVSGMFFYALARQEGTNFQPHFIYKTTSLAVDNVSTLT